MPDSHKSLGQSPKRALSSTTSSNPRRSHPSQSKSLPKNKKVKIDHNLQGSGEKVSLDQAEVTPSLPQGESRDSSSDQSAAKWFASKNENVVDSLGKRGSQEIESPFYLTNQGTYRPAKNLRSHNTESFGPRPRDDTENDELRGVIDDLTVENKKLKHLLRNWQARSSPTTINPDRVVEVRLHGLPAEKKRELEDILKKFATGLTGDSSSQPSSSGPLEKSASSAGYAAFPAQRVPLDPNNTDSGYASISNSGLNSTSQSSGLRLREPVSKSKKETDIENYLHDIPDSLFPRETVSVSDNAKMALVVQRLEQLFTGKRAAPGEHSLPIQQQKISRSAAKADRRENQRLKRALRVEGSREAHILPHDSKINFDLMDASGQPPGNQSGSDQSSAEGRGIPASEGASSPDQRPTRPLDLDIHRAQTAADNIDYIRHLGLSSPQFEDNAEGKEQPWLYLNLLVSMAQLHTLNVTPAFIRKAVKQLSTKFELSKDGHKIRWIGRAPQAEYVNQESPESAPHRISEDTGDDAGRQSGRSATSTLNEVSNSASVSDDRVQRGKLGGTSNLVNSTTTSSNHVPGQQSTTQSKSTSAFEYKPIVFQGKRTFLQAKNSYLDSSSSHGGKSPNSTGLVRALSRSSLKPRDDTYEGYMTFFNNPYFFTDLSGDKSPTNARASGYKGARDALGIVKKRPLADDTLRDAKACYFLSPWPHARSSWPPNCPEMDISLSPIKSAGEDETLPLEFEASGLGGVRPEDNFALDVQIARKRQRLDNGDGKRTIRQKRPAQYSYQVANCTRLNLQPSRLPPPSYVFFTASSSSSAGKGYYDEDDSDESSEAEYSPAPAGFLWQWSSSSNERQGEDDGSVASSSLGVLEAARARIPLPGATNELGRTMSGSLAATAGASWSAASNAAECDIGNDHDGDSSDEMSVDHQI
ncbi:uncharacterized protein Z519_10217 [Cladophialophora bantiana CBS 173.52]|uniref:Frequency clock protein n=1 Tax=Cladophialophora bantiana (strain ATCC 10958 / CBS 173.52 / CDC B-1940 / NIH 8579) TaxID=1442370 RepID=A0A0D2H7T2_CLAB1|nr:uncharacterized protein Z519_10217 [Cladophialophora bantiana CBS 173.52]KIW89363.1 hypothetical protein Z519_10217 [Cladophialophora bantiana CBS 173.52]